MLVTLGEPVTAFYNENDAYPAQWLRDLSAAGHIARGIVDERSIADLEPKDLDGYEQAHFFAGIGGWSYALRLAGWPDYEPVWTGSCPCQPFSVAGKRRGTADDRHLWPAWFRLIRECRPPVVFGEQVGGPAGLAWLDAVHADLEGCDYAVGATVVPAASIGAPHGRHRIYFAAVSDRRGFGAEFGYIPARESDASGSRGDVAANSDGRFSGDGLLQRCREHGLLAQDRGPGEHGADSECASCARAPVGPEGCDAKAGAGPHAESGRCSRSLFALEPGLEGHAGHGDRDRGPGWLGADAARSLAETGATRGFWSAADWWLGRDGKARPIGPGLFPLAHGVPARMGRLRAYGNAIVPQLAAAFVRAVMTGLDAPLFNERSEP